MTRESEYPLFDHQFGAAQDKKASEVARDIARNQMLKTTEIALSVAGIRVKSATGILLRNAVRLCGFDTFTRTHEQLTVELDCCLRNVQRALKRLQDLDLVRLCRSVPGEDGMVALQINWSNIVALAEASSGIVWENCPPENDVSAEGQTDATTGRQSHDNNATNSRQQDDNVATTGRQSNDNEATISNPSLYTLTLNHYRCRRRLENETATAAVDDDDDDQLDELIEASEKIVTAFPKHLRPEILSVAWELAFVCLVAQRITGGEQLAEQRAGIRGKQSFSSPANYLRACARGICQDLELSYYEIRARCPPFVPPAPSPSPPSPPQEQRSKIYLAPEERAKGFTEEERKIIANLGRPRPTTPTNPQPPTQ